MSTNSVIKNLVENWESITSDLWEDFTAPEVIKIISESFNVSSILLKNELILAKKIPLGTESF